MPFTPDRVCALGLPLVAAACVTINIYFPAAAAEKAADRIIDEVWQLRERDAATPATPPPQSAPPSEGARP